MPSLRSIVLGTSTTDGDRFAAELLREELRRVGVEVTIDYEGPETSDRRSILIRSSPAGHADGYRLAAAPSGVRIEGSSERGRFYGSVSLMQMIRAAETNVPAMRVDDHPELELRGIVDDGSRQISTDDDFQRIIRFLGEHKMNVYALPVEDVVLFSAGDSIGTLPADQLGELRDFAAAYHVDLVPILRSVSGPDRFSVPPSGHGGTAPHPGAAAPGEPDSSAYARLDTLLGAVVDVFGSDYVYVGSSGFRIEDREDASRRADTLMLDHFRRVHELVRRRGKTVLLEADVLLGSGYRVEELLRKLPPDVILVDGQYGAVDHFPTAELYDRPDRPVVVGPAISRWGRVFPDHAAARSNVSRSTLDAFRGGAVGTLIRAWAADGAPSLRAMRYRSYAYAAESAWNPDGGEGASIDRRFNRLYFGAETTRLLDLDDVMARLTAGIYHPDLWNHPVHRAAARGTESARPPRPTAGWSAPPDVRSKISRTDPETALQTIELLQPELKRHADQLDYDAFAARLAAWLTETADLGSWMNLIPRAAGPDELAAASDGGAVWASMLAGEARSLAQAFRSLWLRTNREVHLDRVMRLFDYQVAFLERTAEALSEGRWDFETTARSAFIAPAERRDTSYLRTTFSLERGQIDQAHLQAAGAGEVEIWLNDHRIGGFLSIGSPVARAWNVASRLRSGKNTLAVRSAGSGRANVSPAGAVNVYLEIHFAGGRIRRILSDDGWKARGRAEPRWNDDAFEDSRWPYAVLVEAAPTLTAPMFERGLPSRIEMHGSTAAP